MNRMVSAVIYPGKRSDCLKRLLYAQSNRKEVKNINQSV